MNTENIPTAKWDLWMARVLMRGAEGDRRPNAKHLVFDPVPGGWSKVLPHLANPGQARRGLQWRCRSGLTSFRSDWGLRHLSWLWIHVDRWSASSDLALLPTTIPTSKKPALLVDKAFAGSNSGYTPIPPSQPTPFQPPDVTLLKQRPEVIVDAFPQQTDGRESNHGDSDLPAAPKLAAGAGRGTGGPHSKQCGERVTRTSSQCLPVGQ